MKFKIDTLVHVGTSGLKSHHLRHLTCLATIEYSCSLHASVGRSWLWTTTQSTGSSRGVCLTTLAASQQSWILARVAWTSLMRKGQSCFTSSSWILVCLRCVTLPCAKLPSFCKKPENDAHCCFVQSKDGFKDAVHTGLQTNIPLKDSNHKFSDNALTPTLCRWMVSQLPPN